MARAYRVFGLERSYFTRKLTGYLDHKEIAWRLHRAGGVPPELAVRGFPGGIPAVETPDGELMWDSTAMIEHLEKRFAGCAVLPEDPVHLFLCHLLDDVCDEWIYRPAVGSRWYVEENTQTGGWEIGREMSVALPVGAEQAHAMAAAFVRSTLAPLGVTPENVHSWIEDVLRPWFRVVGRHLTMPATPYLFGGRPSLADFAVFGGCAAHFANDRACRRWMDEDAPALVEHTHRVLQPPDERCGDWLRAGEVPETLVAILAEAGRHYLPWVAAATARGEADVVFSSGARTSIQATEFLKEARAIQLGRYRALRCAALDAVLERAGILHYFADHLAEAGSVPDWAGPPRPRLNRPYPPENEPGG